MPLVGVSHGVLDSACATERVLRSSEPLERQSSLNCVSNHGVVVMQSVEISWVVAHYEGKLGFNGSVVFLNVVSFGSEFDLLV